MARYYYRLRYRQFGGHYHCRLFSTTNPRGTYAKLGECVVSEDEWTSFRAAMSGFEFLEEE